MADAARGGLPVTIAPRSTRFTRAPGRSMPWLAPTIIPLLGLALVALAMVPTSHSAWVGGQASQTNSVDITIPLQDRARVHDWASFFDQYHLKNVNDCRVAHATFASLALEHPDLPFPADGKVHVVFDESGPDVKMDGQTEEKVTRALVTTGFNANCRRKL